MRLSAALTRRTLTGADAESGVDGAGDSDLEAKTACSPTLDASRGFCMRGRSAGCKAGLDSSSQVNIEISNASIMGATARIEKCSRCWLPIFCCYVASPRELLLITTSTNPFIAGPSQDERRPPRGAPGVGAANHATRGSVGASFHWHASQPGSSMAQNLTSVAGDSINVSEEASAGAEACLPGAAEA